MHGNLQVTLFRAESKRGIGPRYPDVKKTAMQLQDFIVLFHYKRFSYCKNHHVLVGTSNGAYSCNSCCD